MSDHTVRALPWDGTPPGKCDRIDCDKPPILHVELSLPSNDEYGAEIDLCEEHLSRVAEQARAFVVALGVVAPSSELERNIVATAGEHLT